MMEKPIGAELDKKEVGKGTSKLVLVLLIVALSIMFLALTVAYLFSQTDWTWKQFRFPKVFLISTVVIVLSSFTLRKAESALALDRLDEFSKWISRTFVLGLLFLILQLVGWWVLQRAGIFFNGKPDGSYLYLISGLHALHLLVGIAVLGYMFRQALSSKKYPVKGLMLASNDQYKERLSLLAVYWHFVDVLWLYLLLFFLFMHL